ncbi:GGDEF domain-containing protein [Catellatospora methionotrophica]|uniref:GGDEF domain-containing protein n=1 Tax=Catellatospora methionotrophica TaxID=121620 RepID=UPI00140B51F5|nr:GGDEF domain-containing protein [Catellatospora methionotrophica]
MVQLTAERELADEWLSFRDLTCAGRSIEALPLADRVIAESDDIRRTAQALIERAAALYNLGLTTALTSLVDEISDVLRRADDPRLIGVFHSVAGAVAFERGSPALALMHLATAERSLRRMTEHSLAAVDAWHDLSAIYAQLGYFTEALATARHCRLLCAETGLPRAYGTAMISYVGAAVHLDQRGDTTACVNDLTALVAYCRPIVGDLAVMQRVLLRYGVKRLAALGQPTDLDIDRDDGIDPILADVNTLAEVCDAIAAREPDKAIALLDDIPQAIDAIGLAEPVRLRSIALSQRGEHAAALAVERDVLRVVTAEEEQLRSLLASGMSARLDQDRLRRIAAHYACQATTDPLTGLPNRRRTERFTASLARRHVDAVVGVLDLDGFKAVNDTHGHACGDVVLQRVAGVLARTVRHGDFAARHGGDEFVVVLPRTTMAEAVDIGERIRAAVAAEDWATVIPGTPVGISVGWADLAGDARSAFQIADDALYQDKGSHSALP